MPVSQVKLACDHSIMRPIFTEISHTAQHDVRTGIQTVVRGLFSGLSDANKDFQAVRWSAWRNALVRLGRHRKGRLGIGDRAGEHHRPGDFAGAWLLLPEVNYGSRLDRIIAYARKQQMLLAAIFHDAIPISHPELVRRKAAKCHAEYMTALCNADLIIAVSNSAAEQFRLFAQRHRLRLPPIYVCSLAGEFFGKERVLAKPIGSPNLVNILCVSTLDPRKNHSTLFEAFDLASAAVSQPELRLHLVGDIYKDARFIVERVKAAMTRNGNISWHGKITDHQLANFYRECDFTIFPSFLEGFGLPIIQSLWNRRPCVCANFGAMAETAKGGGCFTVDVRDPAKLSGAIVTLDPFRCAAEASRGDRGAAF